ncbi:MAG: PQQ-binding-like beta-propeller repeat protein [Dehalogenimonas sp.]
MIRFRDRFILLRGIQALIKRLLPLMSMLVAIALLATGCFGGGTRPLGWSGVTADGDDLYFVTRDGTLFSINAGNGNTVWQNALEKAQGAYASPLVVDDTIFVSTYSGKIYALNTAGTLKWVYPTDNKLPSSVVSGLAYSDGLIYYGSDDGNVYALNANSGLKEWEFKTGDKIWATPVIGDGVLYVGSFDNTFYALSTENGNELWSFKAEGVFTGAAKIIGDTIVVGSLDRQLYAIDKNTGSKIWSFKGDRWFWTAPIILDGEVYAPNTDGTIYVIDLASGSLNNKYEMTAPISSTPIINGSNIVVAAQDGVISLIETSTGQVSVLAELNTTVRAPLASQGDIVFVHSQTNETIYALNGVTGAQIWLHSVQ